MEISGPTLGIFYVSKFFALAPFSAVKNSKNLFDIRRSVMASIYSASIITIIVFLTYRGLLFDANSKIPVRSSFRMKSATSKVVTAMDVSVVVLSAVAGSFCGLMGLKSTQELNSRLQKIDNSLLSGSQHKKDTIRGALMIILPLITIISLLALDINAWFQRAHKMKVNMETTEVNVQWYIPFYLLYFVLTVLHVGFANTTFGLARRFKQLNLMLRNTFLKGYLFLSEMIIFSIKFKSNLIENQNNLMTKITTKISTTTTTKSSAAKQPITEVKMAQQLAVVLKPNAGQKLAQMNNTKNDESAKNKGLLLRILAENHESLGKCVTIVSSSYGITVLFILISCLLHLVATAYFLILELLSENESNYMWLQVLWILFHGFRLLMVVEPCHRAAAESKKTIITVCEIERTEQDPILAEEVKKFWQQLLVVGPEFSACGLCRVNRNILTSFSSAICTYLVILIQFQKTNG